MHRLKVSLSILAALVALQTIALGVLALIVYQATPNSILAQQTLIGRIPGVLSLVRLADRSLNILYWGPKSPTELPQYKLTVDPKDWQKLEAALPTSLPSPWYGNLFLTDDGKKWIDGLFTANGKQYNVEVKVRGDLFNHWANRKKSLRIRFAKENLYEGMSEINLIIPEDRAWFGLPLSVHRAHKLGLIHPRTRTVTLRINGGDDMVYSEIEHWTPEMLTNAGVESNTNLYQTGGGSSYFQQWDDVFGNVAYWDKYVSESDSDSYDQIEEFLELSQPGAHAQPQYLSRLSEAVDLNAVLNWYVLGLLSGSPHLRDHNVRLYFDLEKQKLVPIPWDIHLFAPRTILSLPGNPFLNEVLAVPVLRLRAYRELWAYINDSEQVADDLQMTEMYRAEIERAAYRDSVKLQSNRQVKNDLDRLSRLVQANIDFLRAELSLSEILITHIFPSASERTRGVVYEMEITARGNVASQIAALRVPVSLGTAIQQGSVRLVKDSAVDGLDASDSTIAVTVISDPQDQNYMLVLPVQKDDALVSPGTPEFGEGEEVINAPHTLHRFYLVGTAAFSSTEAPLEIRMTNAVTGEESQVIGEVFVDRS